MNAPQRVYYFPCCILYCTYLRTHRTAAALSVCGHESNQSNKAGQSYFATYTSERCPSPMRFRLFRSPTRTTVAVAPFFSSVLLCWIADNVKISWNYKIPRSERIYLSLLCVRIVHQSSPPPPPQYQRVHFVPIKKEEAILLHKEPYYHSYNIY